MTSRSTAEPEALFGEVALCNSFEMTLVTTRPNHCMALGERVAVITDITLDDLACAFYVVRSKQTVAIPSSRPS